MAVAENFRLAFAEPPHQDVGHYLYFIKHPKLFRKRLGISLEKLLSDTWRRDHFPTSLAEDVNSADFGE